MTASTPAQGSTGSHSTDFDLVVLGGGAAGLSAALEGAQRGLKVALLESAPEFLGGKGLVGSDGLIKELESVCASLRSLARSVLLGLSVSSPPEFDESQFWNAWLELTNATRLRMEKGAQEAGIATLPFRGFLSGPKRVLLLDPVSGDERREITARHTLLALGRPVSEVPSTGSGTLDEHLREAIRTRSLLGRSAPVIPDLHSTEWDLMLRMLGFPGLTFAALDAESTNVIGRVAEVFEEFLAPYLIEDAATLIHAPHRLATDFASPPNTHRPANTNFHNPLIGGRKMQVQYSADGRILRNGRTAQIGDPAHGLWVAGSCATYAPELPAYVTRGATPTEGRQVVREMEGSRDHTNQPVPTAVPQWSSAFLFSSPMAICGLWREYAEGAARIEKSVSVCGNDHLLSAWSGDANGSLRAVLCIGPSADRIQQACTYAITQNLPRATVADFPALAAFSL